MSGSHGPFRWPHFTTTFCAGHYGANNQDELSGLGQRIHRYRLYFVWDISLDINGNKRE